MTSRRIALFGPGGHPEGLDVVAGNVFALAIGVEHGKVSGREILEGGQAMEGDRVCDVGFDLVRADAAVRAVKFAQGPKRGGIALECGGAIPLFRAGETFRLLQGVGIFFLGLGIAGFSAAL